MDKPDYWKLHFSKKNKKFFGCIRPIYIAAIGIVAVMAIVFVIFLLYRKRNVRNTVIVELENIPPPPALPAPLPQRQQQQQRREDDADKILKYYVVGSMMQLW